MVIRAQQKEPLVSYSPCDWRSVSSILMAATWAGSRSQWYPDTYKEREGACLNGKSLKLSTAPRRCCKPNGETLSVDYLIEEIILTRHK